jgi:membrane protease YdiL (CAAX protease family)/NAD-dependent dihydropyrimidine dehydrogenase PreA subunit
MVRARPLSLDSAACDGCGRCVRVCPHHALRVGTGYIYVDWERCDGCGKCAQVCDREAISMRDEGVAGLPPRPVAPQAEAAETRGWLGRRRSAKGAGPQAGASGAHVAAAGASAPGGAGDPADDGPIGADWSAGEAVTVVVVGLALFVALQAVLGTRDVRALDAGSRMVVRAGALFVYYALQMAVLSFLAYRRHGGFLAAFGLRRPKLLSTTLMTLGALLATWAFSLMYRAIALQLGWTPPASDSPSLTVLFGSDATGVLLTVLMVVLVGPFVEELLFRGVLLTALDERLGGVAAILLSAPIFAMLHGSLWSFVPLTFLGVALGWLTLSRRSVWPAIVLHAAYNGVLVAAAFWVAARGG